MNVVHKESSVLITRVLIVGLGSIGKRQLRLARELLPNEDIRVLPHQECDSTPEHASGCFSKLEEAIEFAPQLAVIASPASFHVDVAHSLARVVRIFLSRSRCLLHLRGFRI